MLERHPDQKQIMPAGDERRQITRQQRNAPDATVDGRPDFGFREMI